MDIIKKANNKDFYKFILNSFHNKTLKEFLPEIYLMNFYEQTPIHHPEGNVFIHTIEALKYANSDNYLINLAILFHDIGKPFCYKFQKDRHTYWNHDNVGVIVFENIIAKRFKLKKKEIEIISYCIKNHMRFHDIHKMKLSKVKKFKQHKYFNFLKLLSKADTFSRGYDLAINNWNEIIERIKKC